MSISTTLVDNGIQEIQGRKRVVKGYSTIINASAGTGAVATGLNRIEFVDVVVLNSAAGTSLSLAHTSLPIESGTFVVAAEVGTTIIGWRAEGY